MSAKKSPEGRLFSPWTIESGDTRLVLPSESVRVQSNGIQFQSPSEFPLWTELNIELRASDGGGEFRCSGVIVACQGTRHTGYDVCIVFLGVTSEGVVRLEEISSSAAEGLL